jgi:hypothetical protein
MARLMRPHWFLGLEFEEAVGDLEGFGVALGLDEEGASGEEGVGTVGGHLGEDVQGVPRLWRRSPVSCR